MNTDLFQSCGHCWAFQICCHMQSSTFTASSFRIWNSSTGIPSHPLALFIVMLSKNHLTLDSRMSGSRWVITPSWLSRLWRSFLYCSSVYSCHLLISSASVRSVPLSVLYCAHLCMKCSLGISNFLEEISILALTTPWTVWKGKNDRILKEELPRLVGAQYATGDQWRNNSRKNEGMEPK